MSKDLKKSDFPVSQVRRYLEPGPIVLVSSKWKGKTSCGSLPEALIQDFQSISYCSYFVRFVLIEKPYCLFYLFLELLELFLGGFATKFSLLRQLFSFGLFRFVQFLHLFFTRWHTITSLHFVLIIYLSDQKQLYFMLACLAIKSTVNLCYLLDSIWNIHIRLFLDYNGKYCSYSPASSYLKLSMPKVNSANGSLELLHSRMHRSDAQRCNLPNKKNNYS